MSRNISLKRNTITVILINNKGIIIRPEFSFVVDLAIAACINLVFHIDNAILGRNFGLVNNTIFCGHFCRITRYRSLLFISRRFNASHPIGTFINIVTLMSRASFLIHINTVQGYDFYFATRAFCNRRRT